MRRFLPLLILLLAAPSEGHVGRMLPPLTSFDRTNYAALHRYPELAIVAPPAHLETHMLEAQAAAARRISGCARAMNVMSLGGEIALREVFPVLVAVAALPLLQGTTIPPYRPFVDVTVYGARGNGSTNDSTAFINALNYLQSKGGGTLWCPSGSYYFGQTTLNWNVAWDNIRVIGPSDGSARFVWNRNTTGTFQGIVLNGASNSIDNVGFYNITFQGAANTDAECAYDLINYRSGINNLTIEGCTFKWFKHAGIFSSSVTSPGWGVKIRYCRFIENGGFGGTIGEIAGAAIQGQYNGLHMIGNEFYGCGKTVQPYHAVYLDDAATYSDIQVRFNTFGRETADVTEDDFQANTGVINALAIENNVFLTTARRLILSTGSTGTKVSNNLFKDAHLTLNDVSGVSVTANQFKNGFIESASGSPTSILVAGNLFDNRDAISTQSIGITNANSSRWVVVNNHILSGNNRAISFSGDDWTVAYNYIVGAATAASAAQYITITGTASDRNHIHHNRVVHVGSGVNNPHMVRDESTGSTGNLSWANVYHRTDNSSAFNANQMLNYTYVLQDGSQALRGVLILVGSTTWDPPSINAGAQATTTVTVTGAALGDAVAVGFSLPANDLTLSGYVSSTNTVTVVAYNGTGGAIDLGSGTLKVVVTR